MKQQGKNWSDPKAPHVKRLFEMQESGRTLQQMGNEFGLTRERVRQILKQHGRRSKGTPQQRRKEEAERRRQECEAFETTIRSRFPWSGPEEGFYKNFIDELIDWWAWRSRSEPPPVPGKIAQRAQINVRLLSRILRGKESPRIDDADRLCRAVGLSIGLVLAGVHARRRRSETAQQIE